MEDNTEITLSKSDIQWIKLIKCHYKDKYPIDVNNWIDTLKPMFNEIYGWDADEFYKDFLGCMFNVLLDIQLKIQDDKSGHNVQLKDIFNASFHKSVVRDHELPIERSIAALCGAIQCNTVIENGVERYKLD